MICSPRATGATSCNSARRSSRRRRGRRRSTADETDAIRGIDIDASAPSRRRGRPAHPLDPWSADGAHVTMAIVQDIAERVDDPTADAIFDEVDSDDDGLVSSRELVSYLLNQYGGAAAQAPAHHRLQRRRHHLPPRGHRGFGWAPSRPKPGSGRPKRTVLRRLHLAGGAGKAKGEGARVRGWHHGGSRQQVNWRRSSPVTSSTTFRICRGAPKAPGHDSFACTHVSVALSER